MTNALQRHGITPKQYLETPSRYWNMIRDVEKAQRDRAQNQRGQDG